MLFLLAIDEEELAASYRTPANFFDQQKSRSGGDRSTKLQEVFNLLPLERGWNRTKTLTHEIYATNTTQQKTVSTTRVYACKFSTELECLCSVAI